MVVVVVVMEEVEAEEVIAATEEEVEVPGLSYLSSIYGPPWRGAGGRQRATAATNMTASRMRSSRCWAPAAAGGACGGTEEAATTATVMRTSLFRLVDLAGRLWKRAEEGQHSLHFSPTPPGGWLAGSERVGQTGASGQRLKEAARTI